jgi:hypothetical protein
VGSVLPWPRLLWSESITIRKNGQPAFFDVAGTGTQKCGTGKISSSNAEGRSGPSPGWNDQNGVGYRTRNDKRRSSRLDDGANGWTEGDRR